MFIKLDAEGAEKIILPTLYSFYSNPSIFPLYKPAMFISFHGVDGYNDTQLEEIIKVVHLYKYYSLAGGVKTKSEIVFHTVSEFSLQLLKEDSWMDLFITDRPLEEFVPV